MTYKCIVCDLDETLLNHQGFISQENIQAIQKANQDYNVKFVLASGRPYLLMDEYLKTLGLYDKENEYVLSLNGATITENKDHRILDTTPLPFEKVKQIAQFGFDHHVCVEVFTEDMIYIYDFDEQEREWFITNNFKYEEMINHDLDHLKDKHIIKMLLESRDYDNLHSLEPHMKEIKEGLHISYSSFRYMEINAENIHKGVGIEKLAKILNLQLDEMIAIGDNYNDMEMLKKAGLSACPSNAIDEIKECCHFISEKSCNESAVADIINQFIFNED